MSLLCYTLKKKIYFFNNAEYSIMIHFDIIPRKNFFLITQNPQ